MKPVVTVAEIDALLPQTQCGQCGYKGCLPYAKAIMAGDTIDRCPPGGVETLLALAAVVKQQPTAATIATKRLQLTPPVQAVINSAECIGCTKCIQACPVDAIVGAAKQLHFILNAECTGCGLCVEPCPVDCIDLVPVPALPYSPHKARARFVAKQTRLAQASNIATTVAMSSPDEANAKITYIQAALARVKAKKSAS